MKKFTKGLIAFIVTIVIGMLIMTFLQPLLDQTSWGFVPASQVVLAPFMYYLLTLGSSWSERFRPLAQLLIVFIALVVMTCIMEWFNWTAISGKLVAHTIGTLLTLLFVYAQDRRYMARKK